MIDVQKWDDTLPKDKLEFVKGVMNFINTNCVSKEDWEILCKFLLDEIQSCNKNLDDYEKMLHEQSLIIEELKSKGGKKQC